VLLALLLTARRKPRCPSEVPQAEVSVPAAERTRHRSHRELDSGQATGTGDTPRRPREKEARASVDCHPHSLNGNHRTSSPCRVVEACLQCLCLSRIQHRGEIGDACAQRRTTLRLGAPRLGALGLRRAGEQQRKPARPMLLSFILQEWQLLARQNPLLADGNFLLVLPP